MISIRKATLDDMEVIEETMKKSMKVLGLGFYTQEQVESICRYVCVPDRQVIQDGT